MKSQKWACMNVTSGWGKSGIPHARHAAARDLDSGEADADADTWESARWCCRERDGGRGVHKTEKYQISIQTYQKLVTHICIFTRSLVFLCLKKNTICVIFQIRTNVTATSCGELVNLLQKTVTDSKKHWDRGKFTTDTYIFGELRILIVAIRHLLNGPWSSLSDSPFHYGPYIFIKRQIWTAGKQHIHCKCRNHYFTMVPGLALSCF